MHYPHHHHHYIRPSHPISFGFLFFFFEADVLYPPHPQVPFSMSDNGQTRTLFTSGLGLMQPFSSNNTSDLLLSPSLSLSCVYWVYSVWIFYWDSSVCGWSEGSCYIHHHTPTMTDLHTRLVDLHFFHFCDGCLIYSPPSTWNCVRMYGVPCIILVQDSYYEDYLALNFSESTLWQAYNHTSEIQIG